MAERVKNFWQKHPGVDFYSLFWLILFLLLTQLGRLYLPLFIPAGIVLVLPEIKNTVSSALPPWKKVGYE